MTCRKVTGENVTVETGGVTMGYERRDGGKKGSESRSVETEFNNRDDDRKETGRKAARKSTTR